MNLAIHAIKLDKYGYDAPRIAMKIIMIGVFGVEKKNNTVTEECLETLIKFDEEYTKLSPRPIPQLHIRELKEQYETFKNPHYMVSDFYKRYFSIVSNKSLQKFEDLYNKKRSVR